MVAIEKPLQMQRSPNDSIRSSFPTLINNMLKYALPNDTPCVGHTGIIVSYGDLQ